MRIDILSVVPELLHSVLNHSILKRAQEKGIAEIHVHNLRDYTNDKYRQVDDYPYGGGAGMVMLIEPIHKCIEHLKSERDYTEIIYMSPDGVFARSAFMQPLGHTSRQFNFIVWAL